MNFFTKDSKFLFSLLYRQRKFNSLQKYIIFRGPFLVKLGTSNTPTQFKTPSCLECPCTDFRSLNNTVTKQVDKLPFALGVGHVLYPLSDSNYFQADTKQPINQEPLYNSFLRTYNKFNRGKKWES